MSTKPVMRFVVLACLLGTLSCADDDASEPIPAVSEHPIIDGADDRLDLYQVTDPLLRRIADSTVMLGDACWASGDTREGGLVAFDCGPTIAARGSLHLQTRDGFTADKATLDRRVWSTGAGCDVSPVGDLLGGIADLAYTWHVRHDGAFTFAAPALKLLIDTSEANGSSTAHFEDIGDKILVYEPYLQSGALMTEDVWTTEHISRTTGRWWLVDLTPGGSPSLGGISAADLRTLEDWSAVLSALSPLVGSLQLGIGSYNPGLDSWVDRLEHRLGDRVLRGRARLAQHGVQRHGARDHRGGAQGDRVLL